MSSVLANFHFLRPWWLVLALVWLPLLAWRLRATRRGAAFSRLADAALLPYLLVGTRASRYGGVVLACVAGALATLALAGPTWQRLAQPLYTDGAAQVVVVSLSQRMLARDIKPDRMERVRFKVHDLLHANAGGRNGLVAYAGAAFTVAPLTTDAHALDDLLAALAPDVMPVAGDAPAAGIARGATLLEHAGVHGGSLVVVTDRVDAAALAAARRARRKGIEVSVLGVGTAQGTPVELAHGRLLTDASGHVVMARRDAASLRALAAAGGGVYVPMRDDHVDIKALAAQLNSSQRAASATSAQGNRWRDMGPWLLLPLVLLAALSFRRGWLLVVPLVLLPCVTLPARAAGSQPAMASSVGAPSHTEAGAAATSWRWRWSALWHNADQRTAQALAAGHPDRALAVARAPAWRGAAAYRAGDYATAAKAFAQAHGANAAYNLGNALARQGHYRRAIKAYDKALQRDPGNGDARANRAAVRDWLRKHKPPPQRGQSSAHAQHGRRHGAPPSGRNNAGHGPAQAATAPATASSSRPAPAASSPARATSVAPNRQPAPAASRSRAHPAPATSARQPPASGAAPDARAASQQQRDAQRASHALGQPLPHATSHAASAFDLGQAPAHAASIDPLPQSMQRALDRVADDPGGLLRRKFELEYQERQSGHDGSGP